MDVCFRDTGLRGTPTSLHCSKAKRPSPSSTYIYQTSKLSSVLNLESLGSSFRAFHHLLTAFLWEQEKMNTEEEGAWMWGTGKDVQIRMGSLRIWATRQMLRHPRQCTHNQGMEKHLKCTGAASVFPLEHGTVWFGGKYMTFRARQFLVWVLFHFWVNLGKWLNLSELLLPHHAIKIIKFSFWYY